MSRSRHGCDDGEVDHIHLLRRLDNEYDGWVLHTSSTALTDVLNIAGPRLGARGPVPRHRRGDVGVAELAAATGVRMSEWRLEFPAPAPWLNMNSRLQHRAQAGERKLWRDAAHVWAKHRKLPKGLTKVRIDATLAFPTNRRRDVSNYMATVKAVVDGLVDYGLIRDDADEYLIGPFLHRADRRSVNEIGTLVLEIREVP
jgi:crossover junction endodeoxyribonuclease RusA